MKEHFVKILSIAKMEFIAPVSGSGLGITALVIKLAPYVSVIAALTGIVLGIMSYLLKRKQATVEMEYRSAQIKYYRTKQGNYK